MESITKNRQPEEVLRAMIGRAYGAAAVPDGEVATELGEGWFNVAYRVRLRDGRRVVLKIAPPADVPVLTYERDLMRNEIAAMRVLEARSEVPIPAIDHADTGRDLCGADWFAMPWVDGDTLDRVVDDETVDRAAREGLRVRLGAVNRAINELAGPHFGPIAGPVPGRSTWREVFLGMVGDVLDDGERAGVALGHDYGALRAIVAAGADALDPVVTPRFVEWDLWPGNVLVRDRAIVAVIDHERALWGDPLMESALAGIDLPAFGDPEPFLRGYGRGPLTADERRRRRLYTLYLVLVMTIETHYRGHTDPGPYEWARARLDELVPQFADRGGRPPESGACAR